MKGRTLVGYRYNLFHHRGKVSTLRQSKHWGFPGCHNELVFPVIFEIEAFNPKECPHDDLWPCKNVDEKTKKLFPWIRWSLVS